jgi:hypothetical protein
MYLVQTDGKDRAEYDFARQQSRLSSFDFDTGLWRCPLLPLGALRTCVWAHDAENLDPVRESRATGQR